MIGGVSLVVGETGMVAPLAAIHLLHTFMKHNWINVDPIGAQVKYDNFRRSFWIDIVVFFALVITCVEKHPL